MTRDQAEKLMEALAWMEFPIQMAADTINSTDVDERDVFAPHIHELLSTHFDIMAKTLRSFPDLDPDRAGEEWYFSLKTKYQTEVYPARKPAPEAMERAAEAGRKAAEQIRREKSE